MTNAMVPCQVCGKYCLETPPPFGLTHLSSLNQVALAWAFNAHTCHEECARRVTDLLHRNPRMTPEEAESIVRQEVTAVDQPS
jgi:hypothetical protein